MNTANIPNYLHSCNVNLAVEKSDLIKFYQGYQGYWKMDVMDGCIIFTLPSQQLVASAKLDADKRIEEMSLSLETVGTGACSNTFIVKMVGGFESV